MRADRLGAEELCEIVGEGNGRAKSSPGVFLEAFQADCLQISRQAGLDFSRRDGLAASHLFDQFDGRLCSKGGAAGEALVENDAE